MANAGSTAEILFTVGVQTQQGQAAFNQFFQNLSRGLNNAEDAFGEYENAVATTSEILQRAQRAGESYFESLDRNARETIETILKEAEQFQRAVQREQQERLEQVRVEREAARQRLEVARDAQLAAIAGTANEAAERQRITQQFSDNLLALDRDIANQRVRINQTAADRIAEAQQNAQQAVEIAQQGTGIRGAFQDIFGDLADSARQGTLSLDDLTGAAGKLTVALGPAGIAAIALGKGIISVGTALAETTAKAAEYVQSVVAVSEATGVSLETAQGFVTAFQAVGGSAGDASDVIAQVGQVLEEARGGAQQATQDLLNLGVQLDTLKSGDLNAVLTELAGNFGNVSEAVKQSGALSRTFGEEGSRQFGAVANSINLVKQRLQELGIILSEDTVKQFAALKDQNIEIDAQIQALTFALGTQFAPILFQIKKPLADIIQSFTEFVTNNPQVLTAIGDLVTILADVTVFLVKEIPRGFVVVNAGIQLLAQEAIAFTKVLEAVGVAVNELLNGGVTTLFQAFAQAAGGDLTGAFETVQKGFKGTGAALAEARTIAKDAGQDFRDVLNALTKDSGAAGEAAAGALSQNKQRVLELGADLKTLGDKNKAEMDRAKLSLDLFAEAGIITQKQYAEAILQITQEQTEAELAVIRRNIEEQRKLYPENTAERLKAEQEYDAAFLDIQNRRLEAQKALNAAAAQERREQFDEQTKDLQEQANAELRAIEDKRERRLIGERDAAVQIAGIEQGITEQKIQLLEEQLQAENVGAEERKRITQEISDLERQLAEQDAESARTIREAEQKDAQTALDTKLAQLDQEIAKKEILIDQARQQGATSQELAALEQQLLNLQLEGLDAQISAAREAGASEVQIIQLQTERLRLIAQIKAAQLQASGEIVDAINAEAAAYGQAGQAAEDAANRGKAAAQSNTAAIYSFISSLVGQASKVTRENADEMLEYFQDRVLEASLGLANTPPQIAGLFEFYSQQAAQALDTLRRKQAEFAAEDARNRAEAQRQETERALDDARDLYADYTSDRQDLEEEYAQTVRDLNKELKDLPAERLAAETELKDRQADELAELDKQIADNQIREAKRAAFEQQRVELDSQAELRRIREGNQRDALSGEADFIVERARLQAQLTEAQASGDTEAAAAAQSELDALNQEQLTEEQRQAEIETALTSGKTQEEIDLELEAINAKYNAQQEYNRQRLELIQLGDTAALAALDANFQAQQDLIQQQYQNELTYLQQKNTLAEQERQAELAQEQADLEQRRNDILARQAQELADLQKQFDDRETEIKTRLNEEKTAYDEAMTAIETRVAEAYAKMTDAAKSFFDQLKAGVDLASQAAGGGGGNSTTSGGGGGGSGGGNSTTSGGGATTEPGKPDRSNQEEKKRQISGYQDVLDAFEAGELTYDEANDQMNAILRAGGAATSGQYDTYYSFKNKLRALQARLIQEALAKAKEEGKAADQVDISKLVGEGEFKTDAANAALAQQAAAKQEAIQSITARERDKIEKEIKASLDALAGDTDIPDSLKKLVDQVQAGEIDDLAAYRVLDDQRGSITAEQFTTVSKALQAARNAYFLKTGALENPIAAEAERLYQQGDRGQRDAGAGGQNQAGGFGATPGAPGTPGTPGTQTTTTPPPAGTTEPPKPVRNAKLANDLLFQAQNATTLEQGQAVLKTATEALKAGTIDDDDRGRIRAALDYSAFQSGYVNGFNTDSLLQAGAAQPKPTPTPGTPGTPGRVGSVSDAQGVLSSSAVVPPSAIMGTGAVPISDIPPPQPPIVNIDVGGISGNSEQEIIDKLIQRVREGLNDAGLTT